MVLVGVSERRLIIGLKFLDLESEELHRTGNISNARRPLTTAFSHVSKGSNGII